MYYDERNDKWQQPVEPKLPAIFESSDVLSQCSKPSSIVELEDDPCPYVQDSPSSCIEQETVKISEPSQASHSCAVAKDSDQGSSSCEEEWDETDSEGEDSSTDRQHSQAKSFVKWIVALLLEFQAAYVLPHNATQWLFTFFYIYILFSTLCMLSPTPYC